MENTKTPQIINQVPSTPVVVKEPIEQKKLLDALYYIWDAFDRSLMPFFLVHQTAKDAMKNRDLSDDKVEVGVRELEWISGGRRIFDAFAGMPLTEDEKKAVYDYNKVPVIVHIYKDSDCVVQTDTIRYRYEEFRVPNPYKKFEELYA